ncbi:SIMPL domain-containing protein [Roseibium sp. HPY-6]|uniref:SIMPL domain-containing protein n=1 Tax=Roseibium sp. HPY-6 TaxID=3229852 RepID=UPI00338E736A
MTLFLTTPHHAISTFIRGTSLAAFFGAALLMATPSLAQDAHASTGTITMEGIGSVAVAPDMAVVSTSVATTAKSASDALSENSAAIAKVIEAVKAAGIEAKDIQTEGFGIYPRYERISGTSDRQPKIVGYEVRNGIEVNVRDLDKLGGLLTIAVESGANSVGNIRFEVSDPEDKLDEARKAAVDAARKKAETFASAAGVELGNILSITESNVQRPALGQTRALNFGAAAPGAAPIEAGEETISANVTIRWALK